MKKIIFGLLALLVLAVFVGAAVHWFAGVIVIAIPLAVTFLRIKLSPEYKAQCDARLGAELKE